MREASRDLERVLGCRMLLVAGKGGVGKSTVACLLALAAARAGRVLLCEIDGVGRAPQLFGVDPGRTGEAVEVRPAISVMSVEGKAALAEYLGMIVPVRALLSAVLGSRIYEYFVAAAPGLKELMTVGKLWYEADRGGKDGTRLYDTVVVDLPATGHSLQYLRMPAAARDAFGAGLVNREARRLVDLLTDSKSTAVILVTTAEETPVNETLMMHRQLRDDLGMPVGMLFVNRLHASPLRPAEVRRLGEAAARGREADVLRAVAKRAREEIGWTRINASHLERLETEIDLPRVELPFVFSESFGLAEIEELTELAVGADTGGRRRRQRP
jgi:anion-transporting  ArsA/GET3 family ATPase